jgi:hypothetical protein
MNLPHSFRSEVLKSKRSASGYLTLIGAALIPVTFFADVASDGASTEALRDPWSRVIGQGASGLGCAIFPLFVVLLCTLLPQIEYRNNTWKQVHAAPQSRLQIFLAKYAHLQAYIIGFLLLYNILLFAAAGAMQLADGRIALTQHPFNAGEWAAVNGRLYLSVLGISALQFWAGLRFRNFIVPLAIGFGAWLLSGISLLELHSRLASWLPYAWPAMSVLKDYSAYWTKIQLLSTSSAALILMLAYFDYRRNVR